MIFSMPLSALRSRIWRKQCKLFCLITLTSKSTDTRGLQKQQAEAGLYRRLLGRWRQHDAFLA
jgi:hypothetical protein